MEASGICVSTLSRYLKPEACYPGLLGPTSLSLPSVGPWQTEKCAWPQKCQLYTLRADPCVMLVRASWAMADGTRGTAWLQQLPSGPVLSLLCTVVLKSVTSAGIHTHTHVTALMSAYSHKQHVDTGHGLTFLGGALPWTSD